MHRDIILSAFAKAKTEEFKKTRIEPSVNKASKCIEAYIADYSTIPFSARSLRNAHNDALDKTKTVKILQPDVLNALCMYLGFETYADYIREREAHSPEEKVQQEDNESKQSVKHYKWIALLALVMLVGSSIYFFSNKQRWMIWQENQYVEVPFDRIMLKEGRLKLYKEERLDNFRKVVLTCDTTFFTKAGNPRFWYGKNNDKELEFFTDLAQHPETGKSLKPITIYMIKKYLCAE
ncbi:hypothetical protein EAX61_08825 [Dokdonia sinensis]|uniref:Uncharacterized protein n=1 Tax=Dokdonia sinensis TaxID=2479847 RepID=A0A3M0GC87_9FLAO|nr:hypothetical protein [Dokdonia sinensis]RMB59153.1 hypothetical protein EAX61_08825 [Dokdonia sinensis]